MRKNIYKIGLLCWAVGLGMLITPSQSFAQESIKKAMQTLNITGAENLGKDFVQFKKDAHTQQETEKSLIGLFQKVIFGLTSIVGAIAVILTVVNGLRMVYSQGGDELGKAKEGLIWSALGLLLILFAYIIVKTAISLAYIS